MPAPANPTYYGSISEQSNNALPTPHRSILWNFVAVAVLFSFSHGSMLACLGLASSRLGINVGAFESSVMYLTYAITAYSGLSTFVCQRMGSRDALILSLFSSTAYLGVYWVATTWPQIAEPVSFVGAIIGGAGAGIMWTAQGTYFSLASQKHAQELNIPTSIVTAQFAGIHATIFLSLEVMLRLLVTAMLETGFFQWVQVYKIYSAITVVAAVAMVWVRPLEDEISDLKNPSQSLSAMELLRSDPKMKHMIGMSTVFGFFFAFLNSFINGEVVGMVMEDSSSKFIGLLPTWMAFVAAFLSFVFGQMTSKMGVDKEVIMAFGVCSVLVVVLSVAVNPTGAGWGWSTLLCIYAIMGLARATFEGTLRAAFADSFKDHKEAAFANIVLQNGLATAIGFSLTVLPSMTGSQNELKDGSRYDELIITAMVVITGAWAIGGYRKARDLEQLEELQRMLEKECLSLI